MLHETICKKGDVDMVSLLVENMSTEEINQPGFGGCTPLHIAVFHGFLPVVSILASHGASLIVSKHNEDWGVKPKLIRKIAQCH